MLLLRLALSSVALLSLGLPLLFPWGIHNLYGGLGTDAFGNRFNGIDVIPILLFSLPCSLLSCALAVAAAGLLIAGSFGLISRGKQRNSQLDALIGDVLLAIAALFLSMLWLLVLIGYITGADITMIHPTIRFVQLLPGFWLVPFAFIIAGAIRLLPELLVRWHHHG
jgi:hypothetical protein